MMLINLPMSYLPTPSLRAHEAGIIAVLWAENQRLREENRQLRLENEALRARLKLEVAKRFGASSERQPPSADTSGAVCDNQAGRDTVPAAGTAENKRQRGGQVGHEGHGRHIPAELPRQEQEHELPESERTCPKCGLVYEQNGLTATSEEVDVRVQIVVLRHIRRYYRRVCACAEARTLLVAPAPPKLIRKGKFTVQTWVKFLLDKYLAQIPVQRQCGLLAQAGLPVCKGTVHGGFEVLYGYLLPLYEHFLAHLRQMEHLAADETRWMVFEDVAGKANHRWWLWLFASSDVVCLVLDPHRSAAAAFKALSERLPADPPDQVAPAGVMRQLDGQTYVFTPHLKSISADRYPVYPSLSPHVHVAFCWAHQRRDFTDFGKSYAHQPEWVAWANTWIATIAQLYRLNAARLAVLTQPEAFANAQAALEQAIANIAQLLAARTALPTPQQKILDSMHSHWPGLTFFVQHPEIPMDNNWAERLLRTPVVGRKNYTGHQTQRAGQMGAIMFSIVLTCQLHGISPFDFLTRYFQVCAELGKPPSDLSSFSPWQQHDNPINSLPP
jgi:transposase